MVRCCIRILTAKNWNDYAICIVHMHAVDCMFKVKIMIIILMFVQKTIIKITVETLLYLYFFLKHFIVFVY